MVGEPRKARDGKPLGGAHKQSFWFRRFAEKRRDSSRANALEAYLESTLVKLKIHKSFFRRVAKAGGRVELFVGLFAESGNFGFELPATLLADYGRVGVDLSFDVYR